MLRFLVLIFCLIHTTMTFANRLSLAQLADKKAAAIQYHDSGEYIKDIDNKLKEAWRYLEHRIATQSDEKLAMVLDIDETALSNYNDLKRNHFTGNSEAVAGAYMLGDGQAIEPIYRLYQYAIEQGVAVFFVTARPATSEITEITTKNLKKAGYNTWEKLYLRPIENDKMSIQAYKSVARNEIMNEGYSIILNIGDQEADLKGGFSEANIKLPNPFYGAS